MARHFSGATSMKRLTWILIGTGAATLTWFTTGAGPLSTAQDIGGADRKIESMVVPNPEARFLRRTRDSSLEKGSQQVAELIERYQSTDQDNVAERRRIRSALLALLNQQFDAHQRVRDKQIEELQQRLDELRQLQSRRQEARDQIVRSHLDHLLRNAEGLGWGAPEPPADLTPMTRLRARRTLLGEGLRLLQGGDETSDGASINVPGHEGPLGINEELIDEELDHPFNAEEEIVEDELVEEEEEEVEVEVEVAEEEAEEEEVGEAQEEGDGAEDREGDGEEDGGQR
jgi:hypothetical protein